MNESQMCQPHSSNNTTVCHSDDDTFKYGAYILTYLLVFPVAIISNIGALVVFFKQKKFRSQSSHIVMINMAISDGSFSLTLPLRLAYYIGGGEWTYPDWLCRLCVYCFYVNLYSSILLLTLLSFLRWLAVVYCTRHKSLVTPIRTIFICVGIWLIVSIASGPFLNSGVTCRNGILRCFEPSNYSSWCRIYTLNYIGVIVGFLLPFFILIFCYGGAIRHLQTKSNVSCRTNQNRRKAVILISMVTVTFLVCFLPYHVVRTLHLHAVCRRWGCGVTLRLQNAVAITLCLAASNCMVNPLLYYYSGKKFRADMRETRSSLMSGRGSFKLANRRFPFNGESRNSTRLDSSRRFTINE